MENLNINDSAGTGLVARPTASDEMLIKGRYHVDCIGADGKVKWAEDFDNVVTTVGKNDMLDKYLAGSSWSTGTVYMGLISAVTTNPVAGDTMTSHSGWTEASSSIIAARLTTSFSNAAASGTKAASNTPSFSILSSATIYGCLLVIGGSATISTTTGTLFSAGVFGSSRAVVSGDTLNISYSVSV